MNSRKIDGKNNRNKNSNSYTVNRKIANGKTDKPAKIEKVDEVEEIRKIEKVDEVKKVGKIENTDEAEKIGKMEKGYDDKQVLEFEDMELKDELLRGIYAYGFEKPSKIQQKAIMPIITSRPPRDIIGQAQSGTGKTATFVISLLQRINTELNKCQGMIMVPTRELAQQENLIVNALGEYMNVKTHLCVGGNNYKDDVDAMKNGVHVIVGTPGRIYHLIREGILKTKDMEILVIDEADEMLSFGFLDQIYEIFKCLPSNVQVCLFSATLSPEILDITQKFMRDPISILIKKENLTLEGIKQYYVDVKYDNHKFETLCDLYKCLNITQAVIFCNSRQRVNDLTSKMTNMNFTVSSIHSEHDTFERESIMREFRKGNTRILITTDLLARGIDVHHVSLVINYDLPRHKEKYLHRIGRSGRFGRKGTAINLVSSNDLSSLRDLVSFYQTQIEPLPSDLSLL